MSQQRVHFVEKVEEQIPVEELVYLTEEQILEICSMFMLPFNNLAIFLESVYDDVKRLSFEHLIDVQIYPSMYEQYKKHLYNKYLSSLIDPKTPIGVITSEAISQQATQALLNTFHSVGTIKSGGADGIRENIGISSKRKIFYSILHMKNSKLSYSDVMKMKSQFIGVSLDKLFIDKPESRIVNIYEHLSSCILSDDINSNLRIYKSDFYWWYMFANISEVYDPQIPNIRTYKRTYLRLKFDVQKLYEYKLTTYNVAEFINKWEFQITIPKKRESSTTREFITIKVLCIPSPSFIGYVDIYIRELSNDNDHLLISLIHGDEFKKIIISGIKDIENFYAVSTPVNRLIRDIDETNRFEEEKGIIGSWIYLNDNRFIGIPYNRIIEILKKCGVKFEIPHFTHKDAYETQFTDLPFEFSSHKFISERRKSFILKGYLYEDMTEHLGFNYIVPFTSPKEGDVVLSIRFVGFSGYSDNFNGVMVVPCDKEFTTIASFSSFMRKHSNSLDYEKFKSLFSNDEAFNKAYSRLNQMREVSVSFSILENRLYGVYSFIYAKRHFVENNHYKYEKISEGFDICTHILSCGSTFDGILADKKKFKTRLALIEYLNKLGGEMKLRNLAELTTEVSKFQEFFETGNSTFKTIFIEILDPKEQEYKYVQIALFKMKHIKYRIDVNLDYVNSNAITERLDAMISKQFSIPYFYSNKDGHSLLDVIRKPKLYDIELVEKPEMKILLKSKMFLTDKFDFIGQPNRTIKLYFTRNTTKDMSKEKKKEILSSYLEEHDIQLTAEDVNSILEINKLTPNERFMSFIKDRCDESDLNYVYAETSGSNLEGILENRNIQSNKIICNNFYQVYEKFGLESLRNLLAYDMIGMINGSGYISVEYMNLSSNVTTHNGVNQMTSEGISCQKRGVLDIITFDNAAKYIHIAAGSGEIQDASSTSTCIFLGKPFKMGTGSVDITIDKSRLTSLNKNSDDSEEFLKLVGYGKSRSELYLTDGQPDLIIIPQLVNSKFRKPIWLLNEIIKKDIFFYLKQGIERTKEARLLIMDKCSYTDCSMYLKKIKGSFK